jgi:hypothetical protein
MVVPCVREKEAGKKRLRIAHNIGLKPAGEYYDHR